MIRLLLIVSFFILSSLVVTSFSHKDSDFIIQDDFELLKVASEPLVVDPVDLEFDTKGDAYVLEMPGYPFGDKFSRIVLLKDTVVQKR